VSAAYVRSYDSRHLRADCLETRDGKELERSKNEPNKNPGFVKNRTQPNPNSNHTFTELEPYTTLIFKVLRTEQNRILIIKEPEPNTNPEFWVRSHLY